MNAMRHNSGVPRLDRDEGEREDTTPWSRAVHKAWWTNIRPECPLLRLDDWFATCEPAGRIDNGLGVDNDEQGKPIAVCRDRRAEWAQLWPQLQRLG